jgi:hypothetical protein
MILTNNEGFPATADNNKRNIATVSMVTIETMLETLFSVYEH